MEDNLKPLYFKVGDQVVTNRFKSIENGIAFNEDMADFVGMPGIITGMRSSGYPVVHGWSWPWSAIEPTHKVVFVDPVPEPDLYLKRYQKYTEFDQLKTNIEKKLYDHFENQIDTAKVERMVEKYKANPCASPEVWISLETLNDKEKEAFLTKVNSLKPNGFSWLKLSQEELSEIAFALDYTRDNYNGVWGENKRMRHFELQELIQKYISS